MIVVSNSSPLINLAYINQLNLLHTLYKQIFIPDSVYNEIVIQGKGKAGALEIQNKKWITVKQVKNQEFVNFLEIELDKGESEAITLAVESNAGLFLIDEKKGRKIAKQFNLKCVGLLGILIEAKEKNLIVDCKALINKLVIETGYRISDELLKYVFDYLDKMGD